MNILGNAKNMMRISIPLGYWCFSGNARFFGRNIKRNVFSHLSVVQFKSGVVVVAVAVHPLVHYCYVAIDLLSTFLQRPVLPTLSPTAFVGPATEGQDVIDKINTDSTSKNQNRYL